MRTVSGMLAAAAMGLSAIVLAAAGCSGGSPEITKDPNTSDTTKGPDAEEQGNSGKRLRARNAIGADGSKEFLGWFDKERGENCSFKTAEDGKVRCLPVAHIVLDYSDPDCTKPVVTLPPAVDCNGEPPKYVLAMDYSDACTPSGKVFRMGAPTQAMVDPVYRSQEGGCMPLGNGPMATFYEVGEEVPMADFVQAEMQTE